MRHVLYVVGLAVLVLACVLGLRELRKPATVTWTINGKPAPTTSDNWWHQPRPDPAMLPALPTVVGQALALPDGYIVAWSAHGRGQLEPCGCVAGMHGGLSRRASLLSRLPKERVVALECGGWSAGAADYQVLRAGTYLNALGLARCQAVGLGRAEVALGADKLKQVLDTLWQRPLLPGGGAVNADFANAELVHVVCANVLTEDGKPATGSFNVRFKEGSKHIAITSVVPANARGPGLVVTDPVEAVLETLKSATGYGAQLIVMADLDEAALVELAKAVPGVALIVGGDVKQPSAQPVAVGATRIVHVANEGKTLGWWPWGGAQCAFDLITDQIPDHPQVRALIHDYQERLGAMDLAIDERIGGLTALGDGDGAATARYVGSSACTSCHAGAAEVHAQSRHAHAFETLKKKNYHRDPDCLRCHVTGLALPDGFSRKEFRGEQAQVSCESCHGRGSRHVEERAAGKPATGTLQPVTEQSCRSCHDAENSPKFAYPEYWGRIVHGAQ